jgi:hypothetical protein
MVMASTKVCLYSLFDEAGMDGLLLLWCGAFHQLVLKKALLFFARALAWFICYQTLLTQMSLPCSNHSQHCFSVGKRGVCRWST